MKRLYVLYKPGLECRGDDSAMLSFMQPDDEYAVSRVSPGLLYGRKEMDAVRQDARKKYVGLVSRIASGPCGGQTLRQRLYSPGRGNPWWYHRLSEKQVENDNIFNMLLQVLTVGYVADREGADEIILYGAPEEVAGVLKTRFKATGIKCSLNRKNNLLRALLSRIRYLVNSLVSNHAIQRYAVLPEAGPDVAFQGFWDWSVSFDGKRGKIDDRYFKSLPDKLSDKGLKCGWFLWLDNRSSGRCPRRPASGMLDAATGKASLIFVQKLLGVGDILSAIFDMKPYYRYSRFARSKDFRPLFIEDGYDTWPLFRRKLAYGFCDSSMPHHILMEAAYRRAFDLYKPRMSFTFLELFLASRAFNKGAMLGSPATVRCDMQHASYGREKTFILAEHETELSGKPDGIPMPVPEYFFTMGDLCRDILIEDGFPSENIFVTGSARFDHITGGVGAYKDKNTAAPARVLMVATLNVNFDFEMVKAACAASEGLEIQLRLRSHPSVKIEDMAEYKRYARDIAPSAVSLEEDLNNADLVLFTYSTVAEEAYVRGVPVLRWQANGFSGSVFKDIDVVPSAYSVEGLRDAFKRFLNDPDSFRPDDEKRGVVSRSCFYRTDGMASDRIAEKCVELL